MTTPAKPRQSSIPTPGRFTGIPTPGSRSRSSSGVYQSTNYVSESDDISRALAAAIKANDPSHHRPIPLSTSTSTSSLSPKSAAHNMTSGRRSVAGRPSSAAATQPIRPAERAKTPTSIRPTATSRPPSRQSDVFSKSVKPFEVGDNVRIESLGFEGTLRFLGEIDGKQGLWAGVELSGGFAGKGKNDGSVAGIQYFSCPDKCGVFVATAKLSAPTVKLGVYPRPSSVASSRGGGRTTPAMTGRMTPSFSTSRTPSATFSNGRITPSTNGRVTPASSTGRSTPGTGLAGKRVLKTPVAKPNGATLSDKITEGSRASKYVSMTAQQLNSRHATYSIPLSSPTISRTLSSPSRPPGSPFSTPKAVLGRPSGAAMLPGSPSLPSLRSRSTVNTPRARIPSNVSMPPPPSPKPGHAAQDAGSADEGLSSAELPGRNSTLSFSRPSSSASFRSTGVEEPSLTEQLQSRLDALEYENERLRSATSSETTDPAQIEQLQAEKQQALEHAKKLEARLSEIEQNTSSHEEQLRTLRQDKSELETQLTAATENLHQSTTNREESILAHNSALESLRNQLAEVQKISIQKEEVILTQTSDIEQLRGSLERACLELEVERKELGSQIDELRIAGQETIALYEERLSDAKTERYELEHRISSLESRLQSALEGASTQDQSSQQASSAAQIDNETLRDQVQHLQRKSAKLEEQLEDSRAALERDVSTYQERIGRIRQEEEQRKRDLVVKSREMDQLLKSEAHARNRVEEIEEALRESTVALENARGEVETFRAELDNLDVLIEDTTEGDISSRLANFTKRAASDRALAQQQISRLESMLQEAQSSQKQSDLETKISDLSNKLEEKSLEADTLRKKLNREMTNGDTRSISSKSDSSAYREEVAGLKHIVQELQKENSSLTQRIKILESENQLLTSEAEQLRQEVNILEEDMNRSLTDAEKSPAKAPRSAHDDGQRQPENEQLKKRLNETEMKHARIVHDLNKEISELEALVESKVCAVDELEQEVERLKEKIAKHKKSSKNSTESDNRHRLSSASTISTVSVDLATRPTEEICEICERPGHDIFNCSLLKDDVKVPPSTDDIFCEECENPGHTAAECPHSLDVF
ncbi:hypothetical protein CPB83DRAFT_765141 [Crepidotus variabilis]|uniref:CAP-Gly domain-containing protein n=1 Tax=Crepidotus variabilis TaxID=179855 RepID=A0A9P6EI11_9AGAR|nr:hypothetical protein CPB83DRAFT_765141 [Crepidotus variabilis]